MVPVATERLIVSQPGASGEITDEDLEEDDIPAGWGSEILPLPSSLELDIRVHKGADSLGILISLLLPFSI